MFHNSQNQEYFDTIVKRAKEDYLVWVEQFLDIIEESCKPWLETTMCLNDIGCNVGQFWKGLKRRGYPIEYHGYDIESTYIDAALEIFPELETKLTKLDITESKPADCRITVISATLEHLEFLTPATDNILQTTGKLIIIRTFLGEHADRSIFMQDEAKNYYYVNQDSFAEILQYLDRYGFETKVVRDRFSDSMPKYIGQGIVRTQYIIVGSKNM